MSDKNSQAQLLKMSLLLQLQRRAARADPAELPFVMVNETSRLFAYQQAVLWSATGAKSAEVEALSGVASPDVQAPLAQWLKAVYKQVATKDQSEVFAFSAGDLKGAIAEDWSEWLPQSGVFLRLRTAVGDLGALALFRPEPWSEAEVHILGFLADSYGQSLRLAREKKQAGKSAALWNKKAFRVGAVVLLLAGLLMIPLRDSALAPAEVVPENSVLTRSPLDGVINKILVKPNQMVKKGQLLFRLDDAHLRSKALVALKAYETAQAEYAQTQQKALYDPQAKARLLLLHGRLVQLKEELHYAKELLSRVNVTAPEDGVVIIDDPDYWAGRPVAQGQKVLTVADPQKIQLQIFLPADEPLELRMDDETVFFPNISPDDPLKANLRFISYHASVVPGRAMAYRLRAEFEKDQKLPRIGLRGTAKVYGGEKALGAIIFRKPLTMLQQWLGL